MRCRRKRRPARVGTLIVASVVAGCLARGTIDERGEGIGDASGVGDGRFAGGDAAPGDSNGAGDVFTPGDAVACDAGADPVTGACLTLPLNLPSGVAFSPGAVGAIVLGGDCTLDTTTGAIDCSGGPVRAAGLGVVDAIGFEVVSGAGAELALLTLESLTVADITRVVGDRPLVLWAADRIDVDGVLDVSATADVPGPGGDAGGAMEEVGAGSGGGGTYPEIADPDCNDYGGGGGGFGTPGAHGGEELDLDCVAGPAGATGGVSFGNPGLVPLLGGSGGGGGTTVDCGGVGGGGGGAVELFAGVAITVAGTVNAGGGGGGGGCRGGGGGGSGGGILLAAPAVQITGILAATGGGGGGGGEGDGTMISATDGENGRSDGAAAAGGAGIDNDGVRSGDGGDGGTELVVSGYGRNGDSGGGGGGGVGRIAIHTRGGSAGGTPIRMDPAPFFDVLP